MSITQCILTNNHKGLRQLLLDSEPASIATMRIMDMSPMRFAIKQGSFECIDVLLDFGANLNDFDCLQALLKKVLKRQGDVATLIPLMRRIAYLLTYETWPPKTLGNPIVFGSKSRLTNEELMTLVKPAIESGSIDALKLLIKKGLAVNGYMPNGMTPLIWASRCYDQLPSTSPAEPRDTVRSSGIMQCIQALLKAGANPLMKSQNGCVTAISIAATSETPDLALIRLLASEKQSAS
jgi:ankyrin repeat protein